jgi:hypothetical protein
MLVCFWVVAKCHLLNVFMAASSLYRLLARKVCVRQCSLAAGTRAGIKKALQRVFSWVRWAE